MGVLSAGSLAGGSGHVPAKAPYLAVGRVPPANLHEVSGRGW